MSRSEYFANLELQRNTLCDWHEILRKRDALRVAPKRKPRLSLFQRILRIFW